MNKEDIKNQIREILKEFGPLAGPQRGSMGEPMNSDADRILDKAMSMLADYDDNVDRLMDYLMSSHNELEQEEWEYIEDQLHQEVDPSYESSEFDSEDPFFIPENKGNSSENHINWLLGENFFKSNKTKAVNYALENIREWVDVETLNQLIERTFDEQSPHDNPQIKFNMVVSEVVGYIEEALYEYVVIEHKLIEENQFASVLDKVAVQIVFNTNR